MIKYRYIPFNIGKKVRSARDPSGTVFILKSLFNFAAVFRKNRSKVERVVFSYFDGNVRLGYIIYDTL